MSRKNRRRKKGCFYFLFRICFVLFVAVCVVGAVVMRNDDGSKEGGGVSLFEKVPYEKVEESEHGDPKQEIKTEFYYGQLSEEQKTAYREIQSGLAQQKEEIYIHCDRPEDANRILKLVLRDHPEFFWCDGEVSSTSYQKAFSEESYTVVVPSYNCTQEERAKRQEQIALAADQMLAEISDHASAYDKILSVYESIIDSTDYEEGVSDSQNIYSVFGNGVSVCAGYAKSLQYLLEQVGIPAIYVVGETNGGESHAWVIAKCEETYCHVDVTWGDPVYQGAEAEQLPAEFRNISYDYMCCSDEEIRRTHRIVGEYSYPECPSMEYNYYVRQGMYYDSFDRGQVLAVMNDAVYERKNPTVLKFSNADDYGRAKDAVLNELYHIAAQNFCRFYGTDEAKFYYEENEDLNKFSIYWEFP